MYGFDQAQFMKKITENCQRLDKKWSPYAKALRKTYPGITNEKINRTLQCLENVDVNLTEHAGRMNEATQPSDIGPFKRYAFDIITATMPNMILEDLASIQPLQQKMGQIFTMEYLYGTTKGGVSAGDVMLSPFTNMPAYNSDYSSEHVSNELTGVAVAAQVGNLSFIPIRPGTVIFDVDGAFVSDDGNNVLKGAGTLAAISGTIDYATGEYSFTLAGAPTTDVSVSYDTDLESGPVSAPEVTLRVREFPIMARPRKLRSLYAFDAAYDLKVSQGIDIDEELSKAVSSQLRHECDGEGLGDMYAQAATTSTWNKYYPTTYGGSYVGITKKEHYEGFLTEIYKASNEIFQKTRRCVGNRLVVGTGVATILETIGQPQYVAASVSDPVGPHFCGTLNGNIKVYKNPFFDPDSYLMAYKGEMFFDAGYVWAPYLPLYLSNLIMMDDFVGRRGYAMSYGKKMLNPNLYVKGTVTNTSD